MVQYFILFRNDLAIQQKYPSFNLSQYTFKVSSYQKDFGNDFLVHIL